MAGEKKDDPFVWRVAYTEDGDISMEFGELLSDAPVSEEEKLQVVGKALIALGTRLIGERWVEAGSDEDLDDGDDD